MPTIHMMAKGRTYTHTLALINSFECHLRVGAVLSITEYLCSTMSRHPHLLGHAPFHPLLVQNQSALITNWKNILRLLMNFNCVRLVLSGLPKCAHGVDLSTADEPFQYDHGIVYYRLPQAALRLGNPATDVKSPLCVYFELGYDFVRLCHSGVESNGTDRKWTITFTPNRKLYVNNFDYTFNGGKEI